MDVLARLGGDEFVVLLPATDFLGARIVASRLADAARYLIGVSAGVATWDRAESGAALLARADDELMQLKRERGSRR